MISLKEIEILEGKTGFLKTRLEKVYRLLEILQEISLHPLLSKSLALKGGTAINLFLLNCPRLSVDIDFDFIGAVNKKETNEIRKEVGQALGNILRFFRYAIQSNSTEGIDQYYVSYETLSKGRDKLKVEVNYLLRSPLEKTNLRQVSVPFPLKFKTRLLSLEEIYAAKCVALFDRITPRDLYDVYLLNTKAASKYNFERLKRLFLFYASISRSSFHDFKVEDIQSMTEKEMKNQLWPLLSRVNKPTKVQMLKKVSPFLRKLLTLNANEKKFFEEYYQANPDFSLLFDNPRMIQLCQTHPMVLWKQQHLKIFVAAKSKI